MKRMWSDINLGRLRDSEGFVHYSSVGVQTGKTLCNMLWNQVGTREVAMTSTKKAVTCHECIGIVKGVADAILPLPK